MAYIGLFFVTSNKLIVTTYGKQEAMHQGGLMVPPEGHDRVWRQNYEQEYQKSYDFFPRGRVAYNTTSKQYVIYHEKCLKKAQLEAIKEKFELIDEAVRYTVDPYYSCDRCNKILDDDDWFE